MPVRTHFVYRAWPGENAADRPDYYSKRAALASFLDALAAYPHSADVIFLWDGTCPTDLRIALADVGEVIELPSVGNSRSYRVALGLLDSRPWAEDELVYLCEDDYLHTRQAFNVLHTAASALPQAAFFTLYDHPQFNSTRIHLRYKRATNAAAADIEGIRWQPVWGTPLTYGARVGWLRKVSGVHFICSSGSTPSDYRLWLATQGYRQYQALASQRDAPRSDLQALASRLKRLVTRQDRQEHLLVSATPAQATHLHLPWIAEGQNWAAVAEGVSSLGAADWASA